MLLGGILQRAVESGRVPTNPTRLVRKAKPNRRQEVRPLAPISVEAMRAASNPRNATPLSVLAYAGLRPGEALAYWVRVELATRNDSGAYSVVVDGLSVPGGTGVDRWRLEHEPGRPLGTSLSARLPLARSVSSRKGLRTITAPAPAVVIET